MSSPPSSPRHASHRPERVKRTYGSRAKQTRPALKLPSQRSSSSTSSSIWASNTLRASSPPSLIYPRCSSPVNAGFSSSGFRIHTPEEETNVKLETYALEDEEPGEREETDETRPELQRKALIPVGESDRSNVTSLKRTTFSETKLQSTIIIETKTTQQSRSAAGKQASLKSFFTFGSQPKTVKSKSSANNLRVEESGSAVNVTSTAEEKQPSAKSKQPSSLQQLHLVPVRLSSIASSSSGFQTTLSNASLLTTCSKCNMSYIRGGIGQQDEIIHKQHCQRVTEGVKWDTRAIPQPTGSSVTMTGGKLSSWRAGKGDKAKKRNGAVGQVVERNVEFGMGKEFGTGKGKEKALGNVVCVDGYEAASDKRVMEILESVDTVLSAPALPDPMLSRCKIFLFTTSSPPPQTASKRLKPTSKSSSSSSTSTAKPIERVIGCVVVQPIQTALRVLGDEELRESEQESRDGGRKRRRDDLVIIGENVQDEGDMTAGMAKDVSTKAVICLAIGFLRPLTLVNRDVCRPERLPCKIGIHRVFTVPKYRGLGISKILLDVACERTIYGYTCDPVKGEVAFSQPTSSGKALMDAWGGVHVRVFVEDEQQDVEEGA
ncbi:hypothetical protein QFC21_002514 [Naganishia friedmannii]|uniref:Uncharacterized protein n=1 Tax=Naganishia friedmannii TaxID=89922 RepID=A0ACC2VW25_9TREE|nr:hypothetical protein QFC21_002514 [Naganishia friedmannii]